MTGKISSHAGSAFTELLPSASADAPSEAATMLVSLTDAFRNVLQTCKSCHQQFRAD